MTVPPRSPQSPVLPTRGVLTPLGLDEVQITGGYWAELQELNSAVVIDHAEGWMERVGWIGNFDAAREGRLPRDRTGREFADSDVYKLMEAMAWEIGRTGDARLEERFQALSARIVPVQEPDGYLNTNFGRPGQAPRYSDLENGHELYCYGHLIQAGVARLRTHGPDEFVAMVLRAADHVCEVFGADGLDSLDGHPEIEPALVELARATGEQRYLDQAALFIERRGHGRLGEIWFGPEYFQDDVPVRDAQVLRGHAVRALYLAAGAVDAAVEREDAELLEAVRRQMARTVARRTYLTGGMGAHHEGEAFGEDFELPADRAYSETCAGVGAAMVGHRLLLATGAAEHADLVERVLYNVVSTSLAADGRAFFYTNTLHQREPGAEAAADEVAPRAAANLRAPWFAVSCCPTNVARTLASLGAYLATKDDDGVQLQQLAQSRVRTTLADGCPVVLDVTTDYPQDGRVRIRVTEAATRPWTLKVRVPAWARPAAVLRAGAQTVTAVDGYLSLTRAFDAGDEVLVDLPVRARWTFADPRVDAVRGQVAVERGPLVLCLESTDLGADVATATVDVSAPPVEAGGQVLVPVRRLALADSAWPYTSEVVGGERAPTVEAADSQRGAADGVAGDGVEDAELVPLLPYHSWGNRGPSTMRVWLPVAAS